MAPMHAAAHGSDASLTSGQLISDEQLKAATGRSRKKWFRALDEVGAESWDHKRIERWLGGKKVVDAWWAAAVTADYLSSRTTISSGPTSRMSVSRTIRVSLEQLWPFIDDAESRRTWLDCEFEERARPFPKSLALEAADGSRITISSRAAAPTQSGQERTIVTVSHSRLPQHVDLAETKKFWKAALSDLAAAAA